ncbi:AAA family ATPase [Sphingobium baderi]|uniref:NadR/Ttd14 AAA domain-containing protein n=1 Tax=Sphingobium baderi LL03 TaxID=1114964 RepID=T0GHH6_9SPHN|nr:AAA family ATPase [Sphingobium baderi]EQB00137.1 hypothetical protein L485_14540 [Sphingobium baderi LL03]KMS62056.1 ATPase [Sphingobium baderi LL03]
MDNHVVISGCSGGGKSTLIEALHRRGHAVVEEPGRRIVREEMEGTGAALPWVDLSAFARRAIAMALDDRKNASAVDGWVFFDRGLIDAAAALQHASGQPAVTQLGRHHRYHPRVFFAPPWPELFVSDDERPHDLSESMAEYQRLLTAYAALGYEIDILPRAGVEQRADYILARLAED